MEGIVTVWQLGMKAAKPETTVHDKVSNQIKFYDNKMWPLPLNHQIPDKQTSDDKVQEEKVFLLSRDEFISITKNVVRTGIAYNTRIVAIKSLLTITKVSV